MLDDDEAVAIAVGLRAAAGASIEGMEEISVRALAKLEQVLPNRLRRRVNAVHTNVSSMRWGGNQTTVDAEALAVLAMACRDNEQVRFDYTRRDGDNASRLVEPHALVSAGRRWYLVGWDVRREDWRTFRLDRLTGPRLGGVRFKPRELPAPDAAAYVRQSIAAMPVPFEATLVVAGALDDVPRVDPLRRRPHRPDRRHDLPGRAALRHPSVARHRDHAAGERVRRDDRGTRGSAARGPAVRLPTPAGVGECLDGPDQREVLHRAQAGRVDELLVARLDRVLGDPAVPFAERDAELTTGEV